MKAVVAKVGLLAVVAAAAIVSGCSGTVSSQKGPGDTPAQNSPELRAENNSNKPSDTGAGYPKLATAVSTAEIKALDGSVFKVADKQGTVMLLNLWATWCGPCRSEMPALVRMQETHSGRGFQVIGLNTDDEDVQTINDFASQLKLNYQIAYADTSLQSSMLKISKFPGIPQSFLIDRDGRLRGVFRGANPADVAKMEEVVAKVVGESDPPAAPAAPAAENVPVAQ